ncbi:MAG: hypothetical protein BroJett041_17210 [Candidatus Jettenia caeni]|nr:MAG: hypothetical protein BroJett041_17210 [Candidatus Jettenia caeni]GJQ45590.1 MAG: hypothetical protein JETCAE04_13440 [Candidatus Jettenia caeni]
MPFIDRPLKDIPAKEGTAKAKITTIATIGTKIFFNIKYTPYKVSERDKVRLLSFFLLKKNTVYYSTFKKNVKFFNF